MRRTFKIVVFYVFLTASIQLLAGAGVLGAMGVDIAPGVSSAEQDARTAAESLDGSDSDNTLFGLITGVANSVSTIFKVVFAVPNLLLHIGIPGPIVAFLTAPLVFVVAYDGAHLLTGRFS